MIDVQELVGPVSKETKRGSTRIVYFPTNKRKIILDGTEIEINTVLKVAVPHRCLELDSGRCDLGIFQNKVECGEQHLKYGIFVKNSDGTYFTNPSGILSPIINYDAEFRWLEMVLVQPMNAYYFNGLTANQDYPAGLFFDNAANVAKKYYTNLNRQEGFQYERFIDDEKYYSILEHPWVKLYISWMEEEKMNPFDFVTKNFGYFEHPASKEKTIAICDYGFSEEFNRYFDFIEDSS